MYNVPTIYIFFYFHIVILTWCDFYTLNSQHYLKNCLNCKSRNGSEKNPNKVKLVYIHVNVSPITCLSVYAINQCWCHVKLQKHKFKFAQFNYPYFKTKHDIVYIYRKIVPQVHETGPAVHKYEMLFFKI